MVAVVPVAGPWPPATGSPVLGSRNSGRSLGRLNWSMLSSVPAMASFDPPPIRWLASQLSSMNRTTELCIVNELSTKLCRLYGEMTSSGCRMPTPQRACWPLGTLAAFAPHWPGAESVSSGVCDWVRIGPIWWSYQPSQSS